MGRSRGDLASWALQKAGEYLESAEANIEAVLIKVLPNKITHYYP